MSHSIQSVVSPINPHSKLDPKVSEELGEIDASIRSSVCLFLISAVCWLVLGTLFALVAAYKLHAPEFLSAIEFFTFGRMRSAHVNAVTFGWANNAVFAVCLWIMVRLCRVPIRHGGLLLIAGILWNTGLVIGILGILRGDLTSVEWLDIPLYATPLLVVSYALIAVWGIMAFCFRKGASTYVSQWYILAGLFWFPWIYMAAQAIILWFPARGVVQPIANSWFAHNLLGLWFTPMALAVAYYLIPKILGRPIYAYYLSTFGFWGLALFSSWAGMHYLIGGPVPAWLVSTGVVASVMMAVPVSVIAINLHMTVLGCLGKVWRSPALRFIVFGTLAYTLAGFVASVTALQSVNVMTQFTHFTIGYAHQVTYAFFTMILFGGIYYMMPRMLKCEWPSAFLIHVHFWGSAIGITVMIGALLMGGVIQGLQMNDAEIPFIDTVQATLPWLKARSISGILLTVAHFAFALHFFSMVFSRASVCAKSVSEEVSPVLANEGDTA